MEWDDIYKSFVENLFGYEGVRSKEIVLDILVNE